MSIRSTEPAKAMAFFHADGITAAWKQATRFAGMGGHIATLPEVIEARMAWEPGTSPAWDKYFTTSSAEYFGLTKQGKRIIIIAHGVGPMSTIDGILKAYSFQYKDRERNNRGGRISLKEFADLESGVYGPVTVVDYAAYVHCYEYPFIQVLNRGDCTIDPLLNARLGKKAYPYIKRHTEIVTKKLVSEGFEYPLNPYIMSVSGASNCPYGYHDRDSGAYISDYLGLDKGAVAHLLGIGQLTPVQYSGYGFKHHWYTSDVYCSEWGDAVRFLAIRPGYAPYSDINAGPGVLSEVIAKNWKRLMLPSEGSFAFGPLMQLDRETWFTQAPKKGHEFDTYEPVHLVTKMEPIGAPVTFTTEIDGYHGFFRYGLHDVSRLTPKDANAYVLTGEPQIIWEKGNPTHHKAAVTFYRVEVDTSRRIMTDNELEANFELLMELLGG